MADRVEVDMIVKATTQGFDKISKDVGGLAKQTEQVGKSADVTSKSVSGLSSSLKFAAVGGLAAAGAALVAFTKNSIAAASGVEEATSKFNVVFRETADQVRGAVDDFAEATNSSKYQLQSWAATIGDTLKPMGFAEEAAGNLSTDIIKLGVDLASFNNMPVDEALQRLQSTLIGNHENALAFGVIINENTLKAELAAMGMDKLTGAQLEQAKAQARINLLMKGTTDAQGDAVRTSDSYANTVKGLQAAMEELSVTIGQMLLPTAAAAASTLAELAKQMQIVFDVQREGGAIVDDIVDANIKEAQGIDDLVAQYQKLTNTAKMWGGAAVALTGTQDDVYENMKKVREEILRTAKNADEYIAALKEMGVVGNNQGQMSEKQAAANYEQAKSELELADAIAERAKETAAADGVMLGYMGATDQATKSGTAYGWSLDGVRKNYEGLYQSGFNALADDLGEQEKAARAAGEAFNGYFTTALEGVETTDTLEEQLYGLIAAQSDNAYEAAGAAYALGLYDEAQLATALNAAIIKEKIQDLATAFNDGEISAGQLKEEMENIIAGSPYVTEMDVLTDEAIGNVDKLKSKLDAMDGRTITSKISVITEYKGGPGQGSAPGGASGGAPGGQTGSGGGNPAPGAYATGGIVPGPMGAPQLAIVHGGEEVLTPAQRAQRGGGSTTIINNYNNTLEAAALAMAQAERIRRQRLDVQ